MYLSTRYYYQVIIISCVGTYDVSMLPVTTFKKYYTVYIIYNTMLIQQYMQYPHSCLSMATIIAVYRSCYNILHYSKYYYMKFYHCSYFTNTCKM